MEAIKENKVAIALYEKYSYAISNQLLYLSGKYEGKFEHTASIHIETTRSEQLPHFPFYQEDVPWQCSWQSVKQGGAKIFYNDDNKALGYMLYKTVWNDSGEVERLLFYQLEILADRHQNLLPSFLESITTCPVQMTAVNFLANNPATSFLIKNGLKVTTEQVQMKK
ncbi:hypothetical protein ABC382_07805 [Lysinibacillus sp. 1P01SD]|uniref:hypothetical protein n=1 Tax=Lysinibacillus sp. 1P01SD TaxID=3132285 RepID=UPI0039A28B0A